MEIFEKVIIIIIRISSEDFFFSGKRIRGCETWCCEGRPWVAEGPISCSPVVARGLEQAHLSEYSSQNFLEVLMASTGRELFFLKDIWARKL